VAVLVSEEMPERKKPVNESKHSSPGRKRGKINVKVYDEEMVGAG